MAIKKYLSLDRLEEYDALIKQEIAEGDANVNSTITNHTGNTTVHITANERTNWNAAKTHADSAHAPSNAERNIIVGIQKNGTDLTVDSSTRKINITVPTTAAEVGAAPAGHNHDSAYDAKGSSASALSSANDYTDQEIAKLLNNSTEAVDSIYELRDAMEDNSDAIAALESIAAGKANATHSHAISDVTNLQSTLNAKAAQTSLDTHTSNTTVHITSTERTNWNSAKTHADSAHAPSNAQANVIESIKVNGTAQTISSKSVNITVPTKASDIGAATASHTHAISEITNLQTTLNNASSAILANTNSITAHSQSISNLQTAIDNIQEITSEDIQNLFNS